MFCANPVTEQCSLSAMTKKKNSPIMYDTLNYVDTTNNTCMNIH